MSKSWSLRRYDGTNENVKQGGLVDTVLVCCKALVYLKDAILAYASFFSIAIAIQKPNSMIPIDIVFHDPDPQNKMQRLA